jgi:hypothetical protein
VLHAPSDTEGVSDADESNESNEEENAKKVPIPGSWNRDFASAMTINDGHDSSYEYHQNNAAKGARFPEKRREQESIIKWAMSTQR